MARHCYGKAERAIAEDPREMGISAGFLPSEETLGVLDWPHSSGFFTAEELAITKSTASEVVQKI